MKFEIYATSSYPSDVLINDYPALRNYEFEVVEEENIGHRTVHLGIKNGMLITREESYQYVEKKSFITIRDFDDLMNLIKDVDEKIIIHRDRKTIEIYDSWRE